MKNPYFLLPDTRFLPIESSAASIDPQTGLVTPPAKSVDGPFKQSLSIERAFGFVKKMSDDKQTEFLLHLILSSSFEPGFQEMAEAFNIAGRSAMQVSRSVFSRVTADCMNSKRRFEAIVRRHGFEFKDGKLVQKKKAAKEEGKITLGLGKAAVGKNAGKKREAAAAETKPSKKQKVDASSSEEADGEESEI